MIAGIAGKLPESDNLQEFWENLMNGVDMVTEDDRRWKPGECLLSPFEALSSECSRGVTYKRKRFVRSETLLELLSSVLLYRQEIEEQNTFMKVSCSRFSQVMSCAAVAFK